MPTISAFHHVQAAMAGLDRSHFVFIAAPVVVFVIAWPRQGPSKRLPVGERRV
jgi:hypothetical protein